MTNAILKKKLHEYIDLADEKKLKAIYVMVEDDLERFKNNWEDKNFAAEIEKRSAVMKNGSAKTYTWEEVQQRASEALQNVEKTITCFNLYFMKKLTGNILKLTCGMNCKKPDWEMSLDNCE